MLTSKERAELRAMANGIDTIGQIGKDGIDDAVVKLVEEALAARQLVKFRVLETSEYTAREAAQTLAERTSSDPVQVIGSRFVLYKRDPKNPLLGGAVKAKTPAKVRSTSAPRRPSNNYRPGKDRGGAGYGGANGERRQGGDRNQSGDRRANGGESRPGNNYRPGGGRGTSKRRP